MLSTFTKFSANNIDRINRSRARKDDQGSENDSELESKIEKFSSNLDKIADLSNKERDIHKKELENKKQNKLDAHQRKNIVMVI